LGLEPAGQLAVELLSLILLKKLGRGLSHQTRNLYFVLFWDSFFIVLEVWQRRTQLLFNHLAVLKAKMLGNMSL
jgi:hypothetical protein